MANRRNPYRIWSGQTFGHKRTHLRHMVCALLHHEMIETSLGKAKYTAREAERLISKGRRGTRPQIAKALTFVQKPHFFPPTEYGRHKTDPPARPLGYPEVPEDALPGQYERPDLMSKIFITLPKRYENRTGGFVRIIRVGRRTSDSSTRAILCLLGGPRDLKFAWLARMVGKQAIVAQAQKGNEEQSVLEGGLKDWESSLHSKTLGEVTRMLGNLPEEYTTTFEQKAREYADQVLAEGLTTELVRPNPKLAGLKHNEQRRMKEPWIGYKPKAGERLSGMSTTHTGLGLAKGILRNGNVVMGKHRRKPNDKPIEYRFMKPAGAVKMATLQDVD